MVRKMKYLIAALGLALIFGFLLLGANAHPASSTLSAPFERKVLATLPEAAFNLRFFTTAVKTDSRGRIITGPNNDPVKELVGPEAAGERGGQQRFTKIMFGASYIDGRPDPGTRIENRVGEPAANPYLYFASQIHAGLDGIERKLQPQRATESPYGDAAVRVPTSLGEALEELARRGQWLVEELLHGAQAPGQSLAAVTVEERLALGAERLQAEREELRLRRGLGGHGKDALAQPGARAARIAGRRENSIPPFQLEFRQPGFDQRRNGRQALRAPRPGNRNRPVVLAWKIGKCQRLGGKHQRHLAGRHSIKRRHAAVVGDVHDADLCHTPE